MPKISKVGKFRKTAAAAAVSTATIKQKPQDEATGSTNREQQPSKLSRGQRKRQAKRDQYLQREKMILSSLTLKRQEEQKKRIDGMDALRKALLETEATTTTTSATAPSKANTVNLLKSNKSRTKLVAKEVTQMNLVMQHPAFQADPFATIRQHLQNTLAGDKQEQRAQAVIHERERKEKQEQKKAARKEDGIKRKRKKFRATRSRTR